jgi:hypothetical protein
MRTHRPPLRSFCAGRLALAAALLGLALLATLAAGCSPLAASTTTTGGQPQPLPTVTPPPLGDSAPAHTRLAAAGSPAIKPGRQGVPAFTVDDLKQYILAHQIVGPDLPAGLSAGHGGGQPTIVQADFLSCAALDAQVGTPVSQMLGGCGGGAVYGFVLESGSFAFAGPGDGPHSTATRAFAVFDATSGNLLLLGSASDQQNTPPPPPPTPTTPAGQPTPTVTPHLALALKPTSVEQKCADASTKLDSTTLILDNTGSNVAVSWSIGITDMIGKSGTVWASASPASGTIPAGTTASVVVTPASAICSLSQNVVPDATYHAVVDYGSGQKLMFADLVHSPTPP